jgi:hypothetical protein
LWSGFLLLRRAIVTIRKIAVRRFQFMHVVAIVDGCLLQRNNAVRRLFVWRKWSSARSCALDAWLARVRRYFGL